MPARFADEILAWYDAHRRDLPWRAKPGETPDPYAVWLSEIMLQQTTVRAVIPYYARFLARWPSVSALAQAPSEAVMQAWAGLGYYSRARNLHACAIAVAQDHGGAFPDTEAALRALPGIGDYTAAAVAAIAFGRRATVVDGNVERVMARLHAVETPLPKSRPLLRTLTDAVTPIARAGDFAQGMMDLGATVCTARSPACILCPVRALCAAAAHGTQAELPRRAAKAAAVYRRGAAFYVTDAQGNVLLRTRPPRGLLGGMVELPGTAWDPCAADAPPATASGRLAGRVTHVFTHFTLFLDVFAIDNVAALPSDAREGSRWVAVGLVDNEALATLTRRALDVASKAARHQG